MQPTKAPNPISCSKCDEQRPKRHHFAEELQSAERNDTLAPPLRFRSCMPSSWLYTDKSCRRMWSVWGRSAIKRNTSSRDRLASITKRQSGLPGSSRMGSKAIPSIQQKISACGCLNLGHHRDRTDFLRLRPVGNTASDRRVGLRPFNHSASGTKTQTAATTTRGTSPGRPSSAKRGGFLRVG